MNIFIIGKTRSGKTVVSEAASKTFGFPIISAGEWVKHSFTDDCSNMREYVDRITCISIERLKVDMDSAIKYFRNKYTTLDGCVIDGERNPRDFSLLFDCKSDVAVAISIRRSEFVHTYFDEGVDVICSYLEWLVKTKIVKPCQYRHYVFDDLYGSLNECVCANLQHGLQTILLQLEEDIRTISALSGMASKL